jgi:hypothetical protein
MKFINRSIQRPKVMVFLAGLEPAILLAWRGQHQHLGTRLRRSPTPQAIGLAVQIGVFYVAPIASWDKPLDRTKNSMSPQMCGTSCAWSRVLVRAPGVLSRVLQ